MQPVHRASLCLSVVLAAGACSLLTRASAAMSSEEIRACMASNAPQKSSALTMKLVSRDRGGGTFSHEGAIHWRRSPEGRSETQICLSEPPDLRGLAYLILEGDSDLNLWGYLPEKQRVTQIHPSGASRRTRIARTAIGFDDLRYMPFTLSDTRTTAVRESEVRGRKVSVVELELPKGDDLAYERIVSFIDQQTCVALRIEFYGNGDQLLKVVDADPDSIESSNGILVARRLVVEDRKSEVRTELRIQTIAIDSALPERMFVPNRLRRNVCAED